MTIPAGLAAELDLLTQALDLPDADVAKTLTRLAADSQTAVDTYLGLTVIIIANRSRFDLTVLNEGAQAGDIRTSLLIPLSADVGGQNPPTSVGVVLYAAKPGAFIDLAADLSWITGRPLDDFRFDEHRALPLSDTPIHLSATSNINQALGVLIGQGCTTEQAERDLHARAVAAGLDVLGAATLILASLAPPAPEPRHL
jgi:hypothetical protein